MIAAINYFVKNGDSTLNLISAKSINLDTIKLSQEKQLASRKPVFLSSLIKAQIRIRSSTGRLKIGRSFSFFSVQKPLTQDQRYYKRQKYRLNMLSPGQVPAEPAHLTYLTSSFCNELLLSPYTASKIS